MSTNAKIINLVAVRMKSSRLPDKALLPLAGKPVLWHLMDRVSRSKTTSDTVICTSTFEGDDPIEEFSREYGFQLHRGHPENVMIRFIEAAEKYNADHIVRITGDNPLTDPFYIDEMNQLHIKENADYTYTEDLPRGTRPEIFSVQALKKCHSLAENPNYSEYMTLYFKNYPEVFRNVKYTCPSKENCRPDYLVTIDTPYDLEIVSRIYEELYEKNKKFKLIDVIEFLDKHPEIEHLNRKKPVLDLSHINTRLSVKQEK